MTNKICACFTLLFASFQLSYCHPLLKGPNLLIPHRQPGHADFDCTGKEDGYYPSTIDGCSGIYYACIVEQPYELKCPGENVYDPETKLCVFQEIASCNQASTLVTEASSQATDDIDPSSIPTDELTTGPSLETTVIITDVEPTTVISTEGLITTDDPVQSVSTDGGTGTTPIVTETTASSVDPSTTASAATTTTANICYPNPNGLYPYPGDCTKFYSCSNGTPYVLSCAPGLVFNPAAEICDFPYNVPGCN